MSLVTAFLKHCKGIVYEFGEDVPHTGKYNHIEKNKDWKLKKEVEEEMDGERKGNKREWKLGWREVKQIIGENQLGKMKKKREGKRKNEKGKRKEKGRE